MPKYAGILSAFGLALADVIYEKQETVGKSFTPENIPYIDEHLEKLEQHCRAHLQEQQNFSEIQTQVYLHLRYEGTDCALMCQPSETTESEGTSKYGDFLETFIQK